MEILPLSTGQSEDLPDVLIHMTARTSVSKKISQEIAAMTPLGRLWSILAERTFIAAPAYDNDWPVVCFSQTTRRALSKLIRKRYYPAGLALHKQTVFDAEGAPALYVRGDEYEDLRAALPARLAARAVRLWPGHRRDKLEDSFLISDNKSEWMHEREWRLPAPTVNPWSWKFSEDDVAFIILGNEDAAHLRAWAADRGDDWIYNLPIATWVPESSEFEYSESDWV